MTSLLVGESMRARHTIARHSFRSLLGPDRTQELRDDKLLPWYHANKRDLPWRNIAAGMDVSEAIGGATVVADDMDNGTEEEIRLNQRGYAVWVSEIMLQQTQVATVDAYFRKWMRKWPTVEHLARASLEEVNEVWSGLGYYRRARMLHEAAQDVASNRQGMLPRTRDELVDIKGIGPYTAGAVASIAFGEPVPLVDGNVVRVLSRLLAIVNPPNDKAGLTLHWENAEYLVRGDTAPKSKTTASKASPAALSGSAQLPPQLATCSNPGALNQALMELGATVCTPRAPACTQCPVQSFCLAYAESSLDPPRIAAQNSDDLVDIEACSLCDTNFTRAVASARTVSVMKYPMAKPKTKQRRERVFCLMAERRTENDRAEFLLQRRPSSGLLANLLEFIQVVIPLGDDALSDVSGEELEVETRRSDKTERSCTAGDANMSEAVLRAGAALLAKHAVGCGVAASADQLAEEMELVHGLDAPVRHVFSHIKHEIYVFHHRGSKSAPVSETKVDAIADGPGVLKWMTLVQVEDAAISTTVRKCVVAMQKWLSSTTIKGAATKRSSVKRVKATVHGRAPKQQRTLDGFFQGAANAIHGKRKVAAAEQSIDLT